MNKQRVKDLLNSNIQSLSQKENPSLNLIELFEITEHIAREILGDTTPVISLVPKFEPVQDIISTEKEVSWLTFKEFDNKYKFISHESLHARDRFCPEFAKCCVRMKKKNRFQTYLDEKKTLQYFIGKYDKKDGRNPFINAKIGKKLEFLKAELAKL